jgi:type IV pilus assembly protein PilP
MIRILLLVTTALLATACSNIEHEDIKAWMREQSKEMRGRVPPLPQIKPFPAVAYEAESLVTPFSNEMIITAEASSDKSAPDRDRPRQPLENFAIEDLRVTGAIIDSKFPIALVQPPPPNKPKHVTVGEFMGQNFGRITQITKDGITVIETVKDSNGAWTDREVIKSVPKQGGR